MEVQGRLSALGLSSILGVHCATPVPAHTCRKLTPSLNAATGLNLPKLVAAENGAMELTLWTRLRQEQAPMAHDGAVGPWKSTNCSGIRRCQ